MQIPQFIYHSCIYIYIYSDFYFVFDLGCTPGETNVSLTLRITIKIIVTLIILRSLETLFFLTKFIPTFEGFLALDEEFHMEKSS